MHHDAQRRALSSYTVSLLAGGASICVPTQVAYASPLEGIVSAAASPAVSFGLGCATGAVVAGLVVGLAGKRSKRSLKNELDEVVAIAERAEAAARRAEALLAEREEAEVVPEQQPAVTPTVVSQPVEAQHIATARHAASHEAQKPEGGRGVRSILQERLGNTAFEDMPVISRGEARTTESPAIAPARRAARRFDPVARAAIIDRRIPRFDESLFPDVVSEQQPQDDMFEKAMQAMEDSLSVTAVTIEEQPTQDLQMRRAKPDPTDPEAYIEYLIQDEMERNRSGQARRYSRAHLTMFEGTGDLSAARRAASYRPRHLRAASKEA